MLLQSPVPIIDGRYQIAISCVRDRDVHRADGRTEFIPSKDPTMLVNELRRPADGASYWPVEVACACCSVRSQQSDVAAGGRMRQPYL